MGVSTRSQKRKHLSLNLNKLPSVDAQAHEIRTKTTTLIVHGFNMGQFQKFADFHRRLSLMVKKMMWDHLVQYSNNKVVDMCDEDFYRRLRSSNDGSISIEVCGRQMRIFKAEWEAYFKILTKEKVP